MAMQRAKKPNQINLFQNKTFAPSSMPNGIILKTANHALTCEVIFASSNPVKLVINKNTAAGK